MKKVLICINLICLLISVGACGGDFENVDATPPSDTVEAEASSPDIWSQYKPSLDGVTMRTEIPVYLPDTKRIMVFWENNSEHMVMFGDSWILEKNVDGKWERIGKEAAFNFIGYSLEPGSAYKHVYWVPDYAETLDVGLHRIVARYEEGYVVTAEFSVSAFEAMIQKSELDYDDIDNSKDITPRDIEQISSIRIYKHKSTFDTTLVIDGDHYELPAPGSGRWGVVQIDWYEADGREYLIYSYSRDYWNESGKTAHIAVFDIKSREVVFVSHEYSGMDISVGPRPLTGTEFVVWRATHTENEYGGFGGGIYEEVAIFTYENGEFHLSEVE